MSKRLEPTLLINPDSHPVLGNNINGPSLLRVPDWVESPLGRYYLYFSHHQGESVRLAYADEIAGPYTVYAPGALSLAGSGFDTEKLRLEAISEPELLALIDEHGADTVLAFFPPHVASPDVHVREDRGEIWMYYHGQLADSRQLTKVAISEDGLNFTVQTGYAGNNYFRVFRHAGYWFALSHHACTINRSGDGITFEAGPAIGDPDARHTAVRRVGEARFEVYWSRFGDEPEHILVSDLDVSGDWQTWRIGHPRSVRKPQFDWEGYNLPVQPSLAGFARGRVHELRDPGIFEEDGRSYLLYSVMGESGIGIVEL